MAYRRPGQKTWSFDGRTRTGYRQVNTGTHTRALAERVQGMWKGLADAWAWDLLEEVGRRYSLDELYQAYEDSRHHLETLRARMAPPKEVVDLAPLVEQWRTVYAANHAEEQTAKAVANVRWLIPADTPCPATQATPRWLERKLAHYPGKQNTRRRIHSSWSMFFAWCTKHGVFEYDPMQRVDRPAPVLPPPKFYELEEVQRILAEAATDLERAYYAFMYGTGADVSPSLLVCARDINRATRDVRIMGTKAVKRDRVARIAKWAWPHVEAHLRTCLPHSRLFQAQDRWQFSKGHKALVERLVQEGTLSAVHALRNCRHHWAVRAVRGGTPLQVVARQLGNSVQMVERHYARFEPTQTERDYWEAQVEQAERLRSLAEDLPGEQVA